MFYSAYRATYWAVAIALFSSIMGGDMPAGIAQVESTADEPRGIRAEPVTPERESTERRVALVIGNSSYQSVNPLRNPVNDANDIAAVLRDLGFEVILKTNATLQEMNGAVDQFYTAIAQGSVGVFYYAGHGVQAQGENYLIPTDAQMQFESELPEETLPLGMVLNRMEDANNDINIIILDACRDNPFASRWRSIQRGNSTQRGLARIDTNANGFYIEYATAPNSVADDGEGRNGTFTSALLQHIATPDIPLEQMFKRVRDQVNRETGGRQTPWTASSLIGEFAFNASGEDRSLPQTRVSSPSPEQIVAPSLQPSNEDVVCMGSVCF